MTVKNKDGTSYRLRGPNPIMKDQNRWDRSQLTFHNLRWNGVTIPDEAIVKPFESDFNGPDAPTVVQDEEPGFTDPYINGPVLEIKTETIQAPVGQPQPPAKVPDSIPRIVVWCLPATIREKKDALYGDVQRTIQYGVKFTFEAVVVENGFMDYTIWTTVGHITEGSVIFPQSEDRRWWRVQKIDPKTGGYLIFCTMSEFQPDFLAGQS